jgi:hypothetical protein
MLDHPLCQPASKLELQRFRGETDNECSVIHRVEKEKKEQKEESPAENVWTTGAYTLDEQHKEDNCEAQEKRFRPIRRYSFLVN